MEIKKHFKFSDPYRLTWLIAYNAGYRATVTLTYKGSIFPLFVYDFGYRGQHESKVECGQELGINEERELELTVTIGCAGYLDCIAKKDAVTIGPARDKAADRRLFLFEICDNPEYQDYGGLSVEFINYPRMIWRQSEEEEEE